MFKTGDLWSERKEVKEREREEKRKGKRNPYLTCTPLEPKVSSSLLSFFRYSLSCTGISTFLLSQTQKYSNNLTFKTYHIMFFSFWCCCQRQSAHLTLTYYAAFEILSMPLNTKGKARTHKYGCTKKVSILHGPRCLDKLIQQLMLFSI